MKHVDIPEASCIKNLEGDRLILSLEGHHEEDFFEIDTTMMEDVKDAVDSHRDHCNGWKYYSIYRKKEGVVKFISGYDVEYFIKGEDENLPWVDLK